MKRKINQGWKALLGGLLAILGFQGCDKKPDIQMYGVPVAKYKLQGDVKDPEGKPIEGIRVVFASRGLDQNYPKFYNDTLFTNAAGHFELGATKHYGHDSEEEREFVLVAEDIDGEKNGSFESQQLTRDQISVKQLEKGDERFFSGTFEIEAQFVLEKKTEKKTEK